MKIKNEHRQWQHIGPLYHHSLWDAKVIIKVLFWKTYFLIMLLTPRLVRFLLLYLLESFPLAQLCMHSGSAQYHDWAPPQVGTSHVCCWGRTFLGLGTSLVFRTRNTLCWITAIHGRSGWKISLKKLKILFLKPKDRYLTALWTSSTLLAVSMVLRLVRM